MTTPILSEVLNIQEEAFIDPFFGDTTINNGDAINDKNKPDQRRHIIHNIQDANVYHLNRINIASPCRYRKHLDNFGRSTGFTPSEVTNNRYLDNFQGIYIVDNFELFPTAGKYGNRELVDMIESLAIDLPESEITKIIHRFKNKSPQDIAGYYIRLIYYIPKHIMLKYHSVYHKKTDMVFTITKPSNIMHPESVPAQINKAETRVTKYAEPNIIAIDITNVDNPNKSYHMKIGNVVHKLISTTNEKTPSGYSVTMKHLSDIIVNRTGNLEDLKDIGVYETYEEAEYNGDSDLVLKHASLEASLKTLKSKNESEELKLKNDKLKMEYDKNKLAGEYEKAKLEYRSTTHKYKQERKKRKEEYSQMVKKHKQEMDMFKVKHLQDVKLSELKYKQAAIEYEKKLLDIKQTLVKFEVDLAIAKRKSELDSQLLSSKQTHEREMYDIKIEHEQDKMMSDKFKYITEFTTKFITTYVTLVS